MRLDHLLSKEHWHLGFCWSFGAGGLARGVQVASSRPSVSWGLLMGGSSISWHRASGGARKYRFSVPLFWGVGTRNVALVGGWCLARCWVLKARAQALALQLGLTCCPYRPCVPLGVWGWRARVVGFRPYFENYTVDASIFVAKFLRAHGGCLGTRNRRRT